MKKITILLALSLLFILTSSLSFAVSFKDVSSDHWAYEVINEMNQKKILSGYPDGSFRPENSITRAEFAKILVAAIVDKDEPDGPTVSFEDIDGAHWAYSYIEKANKYLSGYSLGGRYFYFPDNPAVREDIAVALVLALNMQDEPYREDTIYRFTDKYEVSENFKKYISIAYENGLIKGFDDGTFRPQDKLTRAQVAQLISNALKIKAKPKNTPVKYPVVDIPSTTTPSVPETTSISKTATPVPTKVKTTPVPKTTQPITQYTITLKSNGNGTITPSGKKVVNKGENLGISCKADSGYCFSKFLVDGVEPSSVTISNDGGTIALFTLENINADHKVEAFFVKKTSIPEIPEHTITIKSDSNGTVSPTGTVMVKRGEDLEISCKAKSGYRFSKFLVDGEDAYGVTISNDGGTAAFFTLKDIRQNHKVEVQFVKKSSTITANQHTINVKGGANGSVSPIGKTIVKDGEKFSVSCKGAKGYVVDQVRVNGTLLYGTSEAFEGVKELKDEISVLVTNDGGSQVILSFDKVSDDYDINVSFRVNILFNKVIEIEIDGKGSAELNNYISRDNNKYVVSSFEDISFYFNSLSENYVLRQVLINGRVVKPVYDYISQNGTAGKGTISIDDLTQKVNTITLVFD